MTDPILHMTGIVKQFPGVRALDGVELEVLPGEVHCLLGQNGAGKSTLIKVLAGAHQPNEGTITWQGEQVRLANPAAATRLGIATIYQELDLVDGLSVAENIFLGHELATAGFARRGELKRTTAALLARLGHPEISPGTELGRLSAAGKQIVSMARALSHNARLIVMDEPSAVLDEGEVRRLFTVIRDLTRDECRRHLHLAPVGGDPRDRRPSHRPQGRTHRRHRVVRQGHPDRRRHPPDDRPHG